MSSKPTKGLQMILQRFKDIEFTCEYKYDGCHSQIHYNRAKEYGSDCQIYTRLLEDISKNYAEVLSTIRQIANANLEIQNFIIEAEIVAWDKETQQIVPFS